MLPSSVQFLSLLARIGIDMPRLESRAYSNSPLKNVLVDLAIVDQSGLSDPRPRASLIVRPVALVAAARRQFRPEARFRLRDGYERYAERERDRARVPGTIPARDKLPGSRTT